MGLSPAANNIKRDYDYLAQDLRLKNFLVMKKPYSIWKSTQQLFVRKYETAALGFSNVGGVKSFFFQSRWNAGWMVDGWFCIQVQDLTATLACNSIISGGGGTYSIPKAVLLLLEIYSITKQERSLRRPTTIHQKKMPIDDPIGIQQENHLLSEQNRLRALQIKWYPIWIKVLCSSTIFRRYHTSKGLYNCSSTLWTISNFIRAILAFKTQSSIGSLTSKISFWTQ